ncbi:MAG: DNA polymerase III subunit delta [bacterium]|nr:DNA polymerase III subunit delta [bacterium]
MLGGRITVIFGENSFEKARELAGIKAQAEKSNFEIENLQTEKLSEEDLINAICGVSLWAEKRLVIIRNLSENPQVWAKLPQVLARISNDVHLCLIEQKIDKRSSIYKDLSKIAEMKEKKSLGAKDGRSLAEFARMIAKNHGATLALPEANFLVNWVGADEWQISNAVERLALVGDFSERAVREFIPQNSENNAFEVFELALKGDFKMVISEISKMKISEGAEGAYQFFGLISGQMFNLAALKIGKSAGKTTNEIGKEIGANAWALGKFEKYERNLNSEQLSKMAKMFSKTDFEMKNTGANAWDLIESLLLQIAHQKF